MLSPDLKKRSSAKEFKTVLFPEPGLPKATVSVKVKK
jgi:hypothetical protein